MNDRFTRTHDTARAAGATITDRMATVGLGQTDLASLTAVSVATIRALQQGTPSRTYRARTLRSIERALQWPAGHIDDLLDGNDTATPPPAPRPRQPSDLTAKVEELTERIERIERALHGAAESFITPNQERVR